MKNKNLFILLLLGAAASLGAAWLLRLRSQQRQPRPFRYLPNWERTLAKRYGLTMAKDQAQATQRGYADLLAEYPFPADPKLCWHLREHILPGLALYRVLLTIHNGDKAQSLVEIDEVFRAWTLEKSRRLLAPARVVPVPFWLFKQAAALQMKLYPAEGWDFVPVENSAGRLAMNVTRCFYLNTLTALGAPELTAPFCKTDDVMAELFPASVRFIRPHTLGRGDALCDFQYCQVEAHRPDGLPERALVRS